MTAFTTQYIVINAFQFNYKLDEDDLNQIQYYVHYHTAILIKLLIRQTYLALSIDLEYAIIGIFLRSGAVSLR